MAPKKPLTFCISDEGRSLLKNLQNRFGVSQGCILEIAIRKYAEKEAVSTTTAHTSL